jgi:hypothetical protein
LGDEVKRVVGVGLKVVKLINCWIVRQYPLGMSGRNILNR